MSNTVSAPQVAPEVARVPVAHKRYLQGLRGVAILAVLAVHSGLPVSGGFAGVDVFFVISGFIIYTALLREQRTTGTIHVLNFYVRRFWRLAPPLAVVVAVTTVLAIPLLSPFGTQQATAWTALGTVAMVSNYVLESQSAGYFGHEAQSNPLLHTWSLAVEQQFYLVLPALVVLAGLVFRRGAGWLIAVLSAVSLAMVVPTQWLPAGIPGTGYYFLLGRWWQFGAGCLLAWALASSTVSHGLHRSLARVPWGSLAAVLGGLALLGTVVFVDETTRWPGPITIIPVLATGLLILTSELGNRAANTGLGWAPLVAIGDWSYSVYLWHWPLVVFGRALFGDSLLVGVLACAMSIPVGWASYRWVEQRSNRQGRRRFSRQTLVRMGAVVVPVAALALMLGYGAKQHWWNNHIAADFAKVNREHLLHESGCTKGEPLHDSGLPANPNCVWGTGQPAYLIGDSHADALSEAIVPQLVDQGYQVRATSGLACPFIRVDGWRDHTVSHESHRRCRHFVADTVAALQSAPAGVVVLASSDMYWMSRSGHMANHATFDAGARDLAGYRAASKSLYRKITDAGHRLVVVTTVPTYFYDPHYFHPNECTAVAAAQNKCVTNQPAAHYQQVQQPLRDIVHDLSGQIGFDVVDPAAPLCDATGCSTELSGIAYRDAHHLTVDAATSLRDQLTIVQ